MTAEQKRLRRQAKRFVKAAKRYERRKNEVTWIVREVTAPIIETMLADRLLAANEATLPPLADTLRMGDGSDHQGVVQN
jgi:hypothetical protein